MVELYASDRIPQTLVGVERQLPSSQRATTLMITDSVGSTAAAVALGDRRWKELRNSPNDLIRRLLVEFSGTEVDTSGDGFFAKFGRPIDGVSWGSLTTMRQDGSGRGDVTDYMAWTPWA